MAWTKRLNDGLARLGFPLSEQQLVSLRKYADLLLQTNQRVNLTGAADLDELEVRHLLDSLTVLPHLSADPLSLIDVGSGGGLPGIPIAIARPDITVTLLDSVGKKTGFLEEARSELGLQNVTVVTNRAELAGQMWEHRQRYHVAIARAVAETPVLLELTLPFVRLLGRALLMKKTAPLDEELARSRRALRSLGGELVGVAPVPLPDLLPEHAIVIFEKLRPTHADYPRRPGIPERRPLV